MRNMNSYIGYEYKEIIVSNAEAGLYADSYEAFGWEITETQSIIGHGSQTMLRMKRDRKIINKMELTRLQRHFDACMNEIHLLEGSRTSAATGCSLGIGLLGTAFMAGSVFAVTQSVPHIVLCILLAIPAFIGWLLPHFVYRKMVATKTREVEPLIDAKYEEIYEICKKGNSLLF